MGPQQYAAQKLSCLSAHSLQLKGNPSVLYQVQVAMFVCQLAWCDFCVWSPEFSVVQCIVRDDTFLAKVLPKLHSFYFSHLLPALSAEALVVAGTGTGRAEP